MSLQIIVLTLNVIFHFNDIQPNVENIISASANAEHGSSPVWCDLLRVVQQSMRHVTIHSRGSYKIIKKKKKWRLLVLMHVDIHSETAACEPTDPNFLMKHLHRSEPSRPWWYGLRLFPVMSLSSHFTGPPVNVTCNIFINSFGSVTETTMVSSSGILADFYNVSMCYLSLNLQVHQLMLPATYLSTALVL